MPNYIINRAYYDNHLFQLKKNKLLSFPLDSNYSYLERDNRGIYNQ